ncbi:hypothetical protein PM082_022952 [Marasmius tenuissimus]|nr:hypothetical protein PM082_022952 [Marasmius tenuissimus]
MYPINNEHLSFPTGGTPGPDSVMLPMPDHHSLPLTNTVSPADILAEPNPGQSSAPSPPSAALSTAATPSTNSSSPTERATFNTPILDSDSSGSEDNEPAGISLRRRGPGNGRTWRGTDMKALVRYAAKIGPHRAPHGKTEEKWREVLDKLHKKGRCLKKDWTSARNKVGSMLKNHREGKAFDTSKEMRETTELAVASLLERIAHETDEVKNKSAEQREKQQKIHEENEAGGEELRRQSMAGRKRRTHSTDTGNDTSDEENSNPNPTDVQRRPRKKARKSRSQFDDLTDLVTETTDQVVAAAEKQNEILEQYNERTELFTAVLAVGLGVDLDELKRERRTQSGAGKR